MSIQDSRGNVLEFTSNVVTVTDGNSQPHRFHAMWLRDNMVSATTRDATSGQRLLRVTDIPQDVSIRSAAIECDTLCLVFGPDDLAVTFPLDKLFTDSYDRQRPEEHGWLAPEIELFGSNTDPGQFVADFSDVMTDDKSLYTWLSGVQRWGIGRLVDGPTAEQTVVRVAERFGYVRETNYGRFNNVRPSASRANLADSELALQAHTDNPYRDPVPTLQLLHCVANQSTGGETLMVDGFAAVKALQSKSPEAFDILSKYPARFEYYGNGTQCLTSKACLIDVMVDGQLRGVRFNNRSIAPLVDVPFDVMEAYYEAYRSLSDIIDSGEHAVRFALKPGHVVLFANTRAMHARTAVTQRAETRWLQGCYADIDGLLSTLGVLSRQFSPTSNECS